jgi:hypothetical protein
MEGVKEFLESYLSKTLNLDKDGVAALFDADGKLKADATDQLLKKDKERVAKLTTDKFNEGHQKATKEARSAFEQQLKEKFSISSEKVGVELVEEIVAAKTPKGGELNEEEVKKSKAYLDLKESIPAQIKEAVKAKETEYNAYKSQVERKEVLGAVKSKALTILDGLKPILSSDANKAQKQKEFYLREIEAGNYRLDGERIILLDAEGKDKQDEHGNRVDFEGFAKGIASTYYDFQAGDPRGGAGGAGAAGGGGGGTVKVFKTKDDFSKAMSEAKDSKERAEITKAWTESEAFKTSN